jgi:hypothetical protein
MYPNNTPNISKFITNKTQHSFLDKIKMCSFIDEDGFVLGVPPGGT